MLKIYGFPSFNPLKVLLTATHVGLDYEYIPLDPAKGEHKTADYLKIHPLGKVPAIEHDGRTLFESGAICRYLANVTGSDLYPAQAYPRALVDQWMDFFTAHLGRWLSALYFEKLIRGRGKPEMVRAEVVQEAMGFVEQQLPTVEKALSGHTWLTGQSLSLADYFGFAYFATAHKTGVALEAFPNVQRWIRTLGESAVVKAIKSDYPEQF